LDKEKALHVNTLKDDRVSLAGEPGNFQPKRIF